MRRTATAGRPSSRCRGVTTPRRRGSRRSTAPSTRPSTSSRRSYRTRAAWPRPARCRRTFQGGRRCQGRRVVCRGIPVRVVLTHSFVAAKRRDSIPMRRRTPHDREAFTSPGARRAHDVGTSTSSGSQPVHLRAGRRRHRRRRCDRRRRPPSVARRAPPGPSHPRTHAVV